MFRANNLTDPGIRKWYLARGWDIGKHSGSHTCPDCLKKAKPLVLRFCSFCSKSEIDVLVLISATDTPSFICDTCVGTCVDVLREKRGETHSQRLWAAWSACSEGDRQKFLIATAPTPPPAPAPLSAEPLPSHEWQHGPHIDSLPTQPPLVENVAPVATLEAEEADDDDEPADWWKELVNKRGRG